MTDSIIYVQPQLIVGRENNYEKIYTDMMNIAVGEDDVNMKGERPRGTLGQLVRRANLWFMNKTIRKKDLIKWLTRIPVRYRNDFQMTNRDAKVVYIPCRVGEDWDGSNRDLYNTINEVVNELNLKNGMHWKNHNPDVYFFDKFIG